MAIVIILVALTFIAVASMGVCLNVMLVDEFFRGGRGYGKFAKACLVIATCIPYLMAVIALLMWFGAGVATVVVEIRNIWRA